MRTHFTSGRRPILNRLLERIVPPSIQLDPAVREAVFEQVDTALLDRPASLRRQLALYLRIIDCLAFVSAGGRLARLSDDAVDRVLHRLECSRIPPIRQGFWGLKTLLLMGYYDQPAVHRTIGYRPPPGRGKTRD